MSVISWLSSSTSGGLRLQPRLQDERGRDPVCELLAPGPAYAAGDQGALGGHAAEPLVDHLDGQSGRLPQALRQCAGGLSGRSQPAVQVARQSYHQALGLLLPSRRGQSLDQRRLRRRAQRRERRGPPPPKGGYRPPRPPPPPGGRPEPPPE